MSSDPGSTFGRYRLLERLSRGGMGQVYRALMQVAPGISKEVAVKRLLPELRTDHELVSRFIDEARITSSLSHANIVQIFDFGEVDGDFYLTMELVRGLDLGRLIAAAKARGETLPLPAALYILCGMGRGLGAAHRRVDEHGETRPVVHRDVSPQNVLISRVGEIKLTDFGIATAAERLVRTRTGLVLGKVRYLAPEQARGDRVGPRADVFACGCVLYECLTGEPRFRGESSEEVLLELLHGEVEPAALRLPHLPAAVLELLARTLARAADERYPDGSALARDAEAALRAISPTFSQDDLAALVERLDPDQRLRGLNDSVGTEVQHGLSGANATTLPGPQLRPAAEAPPENDSPDISLDLHLAETVVPRAGANNAPLASGKPATPPGSTATLAGLEGGFRALRPRSAVWVLTASAVTGGLVGLMLPVARSSSSTAETLGVARPLQIGRPVELGRWSLQLRREPTVEHAPTGARARLIVAVSLRRAGSPATQDAGRYFAIMPIAPRGPLKPVFWRTDGPGRLTLAFPLDTSPPAGALPKLRFEPPGQPMAELSLAPSADR